MTAKRYHLYLEPELWQAVKHAAGTAGLSSSGYIREALREKIARSRKQSGDNPQSVEVPEVNRYPSSTHTFTEEVPVWLRPPT